MKHEPSYEELVAGSARKHCSSCTHAQFFGGFGINLQFCDNPRAKAFCLEHGTITPLTAFCEAMRHSGGPCGPDGLLHERGERIDQREHREREERRKREAEASRWWQFWRRA